MHILPDRNTFDQLVKSSSRIPVCGQQILRGLKLSELYEQLFSDTENSFLLESGNGPEETARYSMMGNASTKFIEIRGKRARLFSSGELISEWDQPESALALLNFEENARPVDYLPHFWGGWVGFIGYEGGAWFESLPVRESSGNNIPDLLFMEVERFFIYDHLTEELKFIVSQKVEENDSHYDDTCAEIKRVWCDLIPTLNITTEKSNSENPQLESAALSPRELKSNLSQKDYVTQRFLIRISLFSCVLNV